MRLAVFGAVFSPAGARALLAAVLLGAGLSASAAAADIDLGAGMDVDDLLAKAPALDDARSGWYLRGDVGYAFNELPEWDARDFGFAPVAAELDDSWVFGIGVGLRLSDMVRVDITADYRTQAAYRALGLSADYTVATALANAYVDIGTWYNVTPYVGAGIGAGYVSVSDIDILGFSVSSDDGYGLAWALMGGAAITLSPDWQLDIGYRYLALDDLPGTRDFHQSAHEVRVGLRYLID